jgi:hypothetical protein
MSQEKLILFLIPHNQKLIHRFLIFNMLWHYTSNGDDLTGELGGMEDKTTKAVTISYLQQYNEVVILLTYTREVPSSNLSPEPDYND